MYGTHYGTVDRPTCCSVGSRDPVARLPPDQMEQPRFSRGGDVCTDNSATCAELARHMCRYWGSRGAQSVKLESDFAHVLSRSRPPPASTAGNLKVFTPAVQATSQS